MSSFTFVAQDVNGDPATTGGTIVIVNNSTSQLSFNDVDDTLGPRQPGETVSVDGGPPQTYEVLGTGNVRNDPSQKAAFIRLDDGTTFAIELNEDGDDTPDLTNGNTQLSVADLDIDGEPSFPFSADPVCYGTGTRLLTLTGRLALENLVPGMRLVSADGNPTEILWIGRRRLSFPSAPDKHKPIRIKPKKFRRWSG